jgi:kynurenine formamidase
MQPVPTTSPSAPLADLLRNARVIDLEQLRFQGMPIHPAHRPGYLYTLHRRHRDTYQPDVHGPRSGASGMLTMMEHSGTHIDALCHQACGLKVYGGLESDRIETPTGFKQLGIEHVPPLLTRGVLLDVATWKGQTPLPRHHSIGADELIACARAQNVEVAPGDVLLVRTGYDTLWHDEETYLQAAGVGKSGTLWAAERGVVAVGADNMAWDAPKDVDPDTGATLFGHIHLLTRKGIYIIENLDLRELARARHHVFAFIGIPLKFRGATGSPIRPLALVQAGTA